MSIAAKIREERERAGLTQEELAAKAKVNPVTISVWENGRRVPKIASLEKLAAALNVSVNNLIAPPPPVSQLKAVDTKESYGASENGEIDVYISKIALMLRDMPEEQKLKVLQYTLDQKQISALRLREEA